jgi:TRAP-type mannitol/chloroaromatic compound transport system substrate-binding protein
MLLGIVNLDKWNALPKYYQSVIEQAGHYANNWMMAKYDQLNPPAMKKLLAGGTKLHTFSPPIMQASLKATREVYAETAATNPNFKKVLDSMNNFQGNGYQWWQVAELGYDSFMARNAQG